MKTAISLPDLVFHEAESVAKQLGLSRSELYAKALAEYIQKYNDEKITARFNEIYATENSALDPVIAKMQSLSLPREDW
jgi:metal-responsive CopG/Arc/MetJ family transcriptional regulator